MLFIILALIVAAAVILLSYRPGTVGTGDAAPTGVGECNWRRLGRKGTLHEFHCQTCKQTAYAQSRSGPSGCKKHMRNSL
ncbi:MAG: hypothetical protein Q4F71_03335 [Paracoccus sp. (in: a-proteobacteria)]|nr:hypothetical protein [Paracoccus sp. (in: a-proteobacteria)]